MSQDHNDAVQVAQLFTSAIEKAMATSRLGHVSKSTAGHLARHEAVAQYLLDHILRQDDELERFVAEFDVKVKDLPVLHTEIPLDNDASRADHLIDDSTSDTDYRAVMVVEDKLDSPLGPDQLDRYCKFLVGEGSPSKLLVLHPKRNPLTTAKSRLPELHAAYPGVSIEFETWSGLVSRMIAANPSGEQVALWHALEEYSEAVGTGDLDNLPEAEILDDPEIAEELRDLFLTAQNVASQIGGGTSAQLRFSFHGGNAVPWLQMAMSNSKKAGVGLELDLNNDPGTLLIGSRGPDHPQAILTPSKLRVFPGGKLTPAGRKRTEALAQLAVDVRGGIAFPAKLSGKASGVPLSTNAQDALLLLASIFQAQAIKNPHRGGAPSRKTQGVNEGQGKERLGAVLVREDEHEQRKIHLFIGPPSGVEWTRCTAWIRDDDGEREIAVLPGESGRAYVLRVWEEARTALGW